MNSIKELKNIVENNLYNGEFIVMKLDNVNSSIIANQYIDRIARDNNLMVNYIDTVSDIVDSPFIEDNYLYVIHDDKFIFKKDHTNTIVLCNETDYENYYLIPALEDWQISDYVKYNIVKGVNQEDVDWLLTQYNKNYLKFLNDIEKIAIFEIKDQDKVFNELLADDTFADNTSLNIWDLSNGLIKKDLKLVKEVLKSIEFIDVEPIGLLTVNYKNFKNILSIQLNDKCTAKDLGISDKQFFVIKKYNCGFYSNEQLKKIFELLTNLEYMYKYYGLKQNELIDYMICKILGE